MNTRRQFLVVSSTAVAAFGLAPVTTLGAAGARRRSLEELSYTALAGQIKTRFRVRLAPLRTIELTLIKAPLLPPTPVVPGRRLPDDASNEKFSLIFAGPMNTILDSAIHRFEHRELGEFDMYLGRIGSSLQAEARYEAGFNRPAPAIRSAGLA